jgi:hypothetical protein
MKAKTEARMKTKMDIDDGQGRDPIQRKLFLENCA